MLKKLAIRVPVELADKIDYWSDKVGLSKSMLCTLALQAGLQSIMMTIAPQEVIGIEKWAELTREIMKQQQMLGMSEVSLGEGKISPDVSGS